MSDGTTHIVVHSGDNPGTFLNATIKKEKPLVSGDLNLTNANCKRHEIGN